LACRQWQTFSFAPVLLQLVLGARLQRQREPKRKPKHTLLWTQVSHSYLNRQGETIDGSEIALPGKQSKTKLGRRSRKELLCSPRIARNKSQVVLPSASAMPCVL
jgi:hypothetical protein